VALQKYFSHPSLVIYFFATPPIKLKLGLGQQIGGGRLLIENQTTWTNYYDGQVRNIEQQSDHIYYTLFMHVHTELLCALPLQPVQLC
jgi:hypothetical protein